MFARAISTLLAIVAIAIFFYSYYYEEQDLAIYALIPFLPAAVIFILSPQINWWWYNRRPPTIDRDMQVILKARLPFYQELSEENKKKFEERVMLFIMAKNFSGKIEEEIPEDMKVIIAASAVMLTFQEEEEKDWLFNDFEQFIVYPHPFPTPQYEAWHITENYAEDGVMLFSAEHLLHGFFEPHKYYQIALHEFINVFLDNYQAGAYPEFGTESWSAFEKIGNFTEERIKAYIGLENVRPATVGTTLFFTHREFFAKVLPEKFNELQKIFG